MTRFAFARGVASAVLIGALAGCVGAPGPAPAPVVTAVPGTVPQTEMVPPQAGAVSYGAAPATVIAAPPGAPYGATCYAGFYTCTLPASLPLGTQCTCPGIGAPSYGTVR